MTASMSVRTVNTSSGTPTLGIRSASLQYPRIMQIGFELVTAPGAVSTYGIGKAAVAGLLPTTPTRVLVESDSASSADGLTNLATAWGTAPTVPANFFRRVSCASTIGVGALFNFPRGLSMGPSTEYVLWIIATAPVLDAHVVVEE